MKPITADDRHSSFTAFHSRHPFRFSVLIILLVGATLSLLVSSVRAEEERAKAYRLPARPVPAALVAHDSAPADARSEPNRPVVRISAAQLDELRKSPPTLIQAGGDDIEVMSGTQADKPFMDIAQNGDIYVGVHRNATSSSEPNEWIEVYRSQDGGSSFGLFGSIMGPADTFDRIKDLEVCEGAANRLFISYTHWDTGFAWEGRIAYADLGAAFASWTTQTVFSGVSSFQAGSLDGDDEQFSSYYLYAVSNANDGNGDDIWYSRSTDQGVSWSAPFKVASYTVTSGVFGTVGYFHPMISHGFGSTLHLAFEFIPDNATGEDRAIRYLSATNDGASLADWSSSIIALSSSTNGTDEFLDGIAASSNAANVVVVFDDQISTTAYFDTAGGTVWPSANRIPLPPSLLPDSQQDRGFRYDPGSAAFYIAGRMIMDSSLLQAVVLKADEATLTDWSVPTQYSQLHALGRPGLAIDPTHGNRVAVAWKTDGVQTAMKTIAFDADWRGDPGYPNTEAGFPVALPGPGTSWYTAPALANVNSDLYDEIIFGNADGNVYVVSPVGAILPGWPQDVGTIATVGVTLGPAVAVGDLNGDGKMSIVQGTADGQVFCFDGDGNIQPGFPVDLGTAAPTYTSIGAVGPPYVRWIVVASGNHIARINYRGVVEFLSGTLDGTYASTPAIGDVDGDGKAEIVVNFQYVGGGSGVYVIDGALQVGLKAFRFFPETASDAITLANLDADPQLEICHPTSGGKLYVMNDDLSDLPGFPFDDGTATALTSASLGQILGDSTPELVFASRQSQVHVVYATGTEQSSYPAFTGSGWWIYGAPVLGQFFDGFNYVFLGARDQAGWAFQNVFATQPPGWPKDLGDPVNPSPALGDIDKDGKLEMVYVTESQVVVLDANTPLGTVQWPMYGFDSQRTGCLNCGEDIVTAVEDGAASPTRVSFRIASRNPTSGSISFSADLPVPGVIDLQIYDLRGRRVRSLGRRMVEAGQQVLYFDGRDTHGVRLAHGQYFARLRVQGEGIDEVRTQGFALID